MTNASQRRQPPRRVVYRSLKARVARVAVGLLFLAATLWIVLPALAPEPAPPAPAGLFIGLNTDGSTPHGSGSMLKLDIWATGCTNPVTIDGTLFLSKQTWAAYRSSLPDDAGHAEPSQAAVVIAGATLARAEVGLGGGIVSSVSSNGGSTVDESREAMVEGTGTVSTESGAFGFNELGPSASDFGTLVTVHNHFSLLHAIERRDSHDAEGAILVAPQWSEVRVPLHFLLKADLMHPFGLDRCYIDVPELFSPILGSEDGTAYSTAERFAATSIGEERNAEGDVLALPSEPLQPPELTPAEVSVSVSGHVAAPSSIGRGGRATLTGVMYECKIPVEFAHPEDLNPNCAGLPVFEAPGVSANITRRVFVAGILGALAATLIVEALFLGETEHDHGRHISESA